jgi:Ca2+-binding EF-hand superfamily protein
MIVRFWMLMAVLALAAALPAQMGEPKKEADEEVDEEQAEVDEYFGELDADKDGKVTLKEIKAHVKRESGAESETDGEFLGTLDLYIGEYVSADADDNLELTKPEYKKYLQAKYKAGDWLPPLTAKDVKTLETELFEPFAAAILKAADADKDGVITKAEAAKMSGGKEPSAEEWKELDTSGDGKASKAEIAAMLKKQAGNAYRFPKDDAKEAESKAADDDPWALYRKKGRLWVHKTQLVFPDMTITTYAKEEVIEVTDSFAKIRMTSWSEGKEDTPETMERTVEFTNPERLPKNKYKTEETITVKAGEFECYKHSVENAKRSRAEWWYKKYPLLQIKVVAKETEGTTTTELIEFKE